MMSHIFTFWNVDSAGTKGMGTILGTLVFRISKVVYLYDLDIVKIYVVVI